MTASDRASTAAAARAAAAEPSWDAISSIDEAIGGGEHVILHAGPPFETTEEIPAPVRHSLEAACLFESWATDWDGASRLIDDGSVRLEPAQTHAVMVPLCGVASPSMAAVRVTAPGAARPFFSVLNEGQAHATRFGTRDPALVEHLRWLNGSFATDLSRALRQPVSIFPLLGRSLDAGDDGHSQTAAGTSLLVSLLTESELSKESATFLHASPAFALNLWMAAVACALAVAVEPTSLVVRAGGNGVRFGLQTALAPDLWLTCPAPIPESPGDGAREDVLPAVGDSALLDLFGLGGQLEEAAAPLLASSTSLGGRRVGLSARVLADSNYRPRVRLGMIDRAGLRGRVAGGVITVPRSLARAAVGPPAATR